MPHLRTRESLASRSIGGCCGKTCLFGFGGVVAVVGIVLCALWPFLVNKLIGSQLALSSGSQSYNMWVETPIPMYFKVYMWNWTNPHTSLRGPDKPMFTQMGPYVFLEHHSKKNITWNDNNNTITYFNQKKWWFVPELSNGTLDDSVTNLNVIPMTIGWYCLSIGKIGKDAVNTVLSLEESLIKTDTVGNLLFNGSNDRLLSIAGTLKKIIPRLPDMMDKFGWFYKRNMSVTADGAFTMGTGQGDINSLGLMTAWNYKNRSQYSGECGRIHGTYGEEFPPNSVDQPQITIYANDLGSVLNLKRGSSSSMFGIPSVLFAGGEDVFSNATTCYCINNSSCFASGVRDISQSQKAPALVSWPHFYLADPSYRAAIQGMDPQQEKHQFYMNMAEVTSVPLQVRARMQLNILMQSIPGMGFFKNVQRAVIPMLWFSQEADLTQTMASEIGVLVQLVNWGRWVLFALGSLGVLLVIIGVVLQTRGVFGVPDERLLQ